jgi:hypothetical protein
MKKRMENGGKILTGEKILGEKRPCFIARSSTTNPTLTVLGSNTDLCGERLETNRLSQLPYIMFKIFSPYRAVNSVLGLKSSSQSSILNHDKTASFYTFRNQTDS